MMLIDGAPRLSLTSQRRKRGHILGNGSNHSKRLLNSMKSKRNQSQSQRNQQRKVTKPKKRVCFDMINKTTVRTIPKVSQEDAEHLWHSNMDYSFFVLNWKYYPNEPMQPRSFLDTLWQVKNTPETMRMEDYQCFLPQEQPKRQKIRDTVLRAAYHTPRYASHSSIAPMSMSMTAEHKRQAQVCAALNEQEVREYLNSSPPLTRDELMVPRSQQDQQQDAMTFLSDYVDSIFHRTAAMWPTG